MSKSIILDAGHGGSDSGATAFGVYEKDWNLKMTLYQYKRLKELGANVDITRTTDKALTSTQRTDFIKNKYDYCISNHFNAFNGQAKGIETIHSIHGGQSFATRIANELVKATGLTLRRVFSREGSKGSDWYFMHRLTGRTTTVIVEYGFLDNKGDHDWYKKDVNFYGAAESVIKAICEQIGIVYKKGQEVSSPKPIKGGNELFKVQTGAFNDIKNAQKLANELKKDGYDTYIVSDTVKTVEQPNNRSVKEMADDVLTTNITGNSVRAKYLGLTLDEYEPVRREINRRF